MPTSDDRATTNQIADVRFDEDRMHVRLADGREISVPLWWYPRLLNATPEERDNWQILPFGDALHWPDLDEDLDVEGFLQGLRAPDAAPPPRRGTLSDHAGVTLRPGQPSRPRRGRPQGLRRTGQ